jgi:outer membrane receptor for Fe3+-dicitrate
MRRRRSSPRRSATRTRAGSRRQLEAVHVGEQFADDLNGVAASADGQRGLIPAYTIGNVALSYGLRRVTLYVTAKNLYDELSLRPLGPTAHARRFGRAPE